MMFFRSVDFPPPVFAITSMFASLKPGSKGEKGMS